MPVFCPLEADVICLGSVWTLDVLKDHQVILMCRQVCESLPRAHDMGVCLNKSISNFIEPEILLRSISLPMSGVIKAKIANFERGRIISPSSITPITSVSKL